jgi:hypothetical protein
MMSGIIASMIIPAAFPSIQPIMVFPYVFCVSLTGCIIGSLATKPEPDEVLLKFYMQIRPWGFWKPIIKKAQAYYPSFEPNPNFIRDMSNVVVGIIWQTSIVIIPIALVTREINLLIGVVCSFAVTSVILKFNWWNKLDDLSKETLPVDFDERVLHLKPTNGSHAVTATVEGPVAFSK